MVERQVDPMILASSLPMIIIIIIIIIIVIHSNDKENQIFNDNNSNSEGDVRHFVSQDNLYFF